jgi:hypothetical protein
LPTVQGKGNVKAISAMSRKAIRVPQFWVSLISSLSANKFINFTSSKPHSPLTRKGNIPVIHFRYSLGRTKDHIADGKFISMKISSNIIGIPNRKIPAWLQCLKYPRY